MVFNVGMDRFRKAVRDVGLAEVAKAVDESPQCVSNWVSRGAVPPDKCAAVETALGGRVTKRDLRPKDWRKIWPELEAA